jgi:hypothetical protein
VRVRCVRATHSRALRTNRTRHCTAHTAHAALHDDPRGHCTVECAAVLASALAVGAAFDFACGLGGVFLHD